MRIKLTMDLPGDPTLQMNKDREFEIVRLEEGFVRRYTPAYFVRADDGSEVGVAAHECVVLDWAPVLSTVIPPREGF